MDLNFPIMSYLLVSFLLGYHSFHYPQAVFLLLNLLDFFRDFNRKDSLSQTNLIPLAPVIPLLTQPGHILLRRDSTCAFCFSLFELRSNLPCFYGCSYPFLILINFIFYSVNNQNYFSTNFNFKIKNI